MVGVPRNAAEVFQYLMEEVLVDVELRPAERQRLLKYMNERHDDLFGPFTTYFVLGSYEVPFKWRLDIAAAELNNRLEAYAYLLAPQPDPEIERDDLLPADTGRFPELKLKYYLHALYADHVILVMEHNAGGDLTELGRENVRTFFERTHVLPRGWDVDVPDSIENANDVRRLVYAAAYESEDDAALRETVADVVDRSEDAGLAVTKRDLMSDLEQAFGDRLPPTYSAVVTDEFVHFDRAERCYPWLTEADLRGSVDEIP